MSQKTVLLTSFATWKAQQRSNASDDLLLEVLRLNPSPWLHFFRQLPVNLPIAQSLAIARINQLQPQVILCCGMAELRQKLSVESSATVGNKTLHTTVNLANLTAGLAHTEISDDAGRYVCNSLYYAMLNFLQTDADRPDPGRHLDRDCLFVHVPILTASNREAIVADFCVLLNRISEAGN